MTNLRSPKQTALQVNFSAQAELYAMEKCLRNYSADIIKKITRGFSRVQALFAGRQDFPTAVLEFGAGIGALALEYALQNGLKPDCLEIDPLQAQIIEDRGFACFSAVGKLQKKYDAIYTSNVLEHIEDDEATLKELYESLKPGGCLAIYVPAFMCLWSQNDELVGHYRRYSRKELRQKTALAGFKLLFCHYVDSLGFFAWLYLKVRGYKSGEAVSLEKSLKFYDRILYPISRAFDWLGCRYFFGKSLLLLAVKPANLD